MKKTKLIIATLVACLLFFEGSGGVTINEDFECEKGAVFEIK